MAATLVGEYEVSAVRDEEGHREFTLSSRVRTSTVTDGPATVMATPGLPAIGVSWGTWSGCPWSEIDAWARCWPNLKVRMAYEGEGPVTSWIVDQTFSTKPIKRCQDETVENPVNEPPQLSGSFLKLVREATEDRNGNVLQMSNRELMAGPAVERDDNRPTVRIQFNTLVLPLTTFAGMVDSVNDAALWGLGPRRIKLDNVSWEKKYYGVCNAYYTITYEFTIKFDQWTHRIVDEGNLVKVDPAADPTDPDSWVQAQDNHDENIRVLLDGNGNRLAPGANPFVHQKEIYDEDNLLLLGIPSTLA